MREALARTDNDFVMVEPRASRRKSAPGKKHGAGVFASLTKKPMRILALVVIAGVLVGIGLNATMLQTARHPAPLFASAPLAQKPAVAQAAPIPAPRPAELASVAPPALLRTAPAQPAARPATPVREATEATATKKNDPIAALLRGAEPAPAATSQPGDAKVAAAQRALQKVGFVVKPNGVFGASTRQALEKFEGDHGLPVTGKLAGRTLKELAAQSGIAIQ